MFVCFLSKGQYDRREKDTKAGSKPGFRNWVPKIGNCKILGHPNFYGGTQYTQISTMNMHEFIKIRHITKMSWELYGDEKYPIICLRSTL